LKIDPAKLGIDQKQVEAEYEKSKIIVNDKT